MGAILRALPVMGLIMSLRKGHWVIDIKVFPLLSWIMDVFNASHEYPQQISLRYRVDPSVGPEEILIC